MDKKQIKSLINQQKSNHTLDQQFYTDDKIFKLDLENIFCVKTVLNCNKSSFALAEKDVSGSLLLNGIRFSGIGIRRLILENITIEEMPSIG